MTLKAPFPWFGGKRKVASVVWSRFGNVDNYVEPFFGSGAVLLGRPTEPKIETINDADGYVANFWRSLVHSPEDVAKVADWPVNENDLHARHAHLMQVRDDIASHLEGDPNWHDPIIAGWWLWGICAWIGSGWCCGDGPWHVSDGRLLDIRKRPHLGNVGQGINRQLPHLGDAGRGINRKRPHLGNAGRGINRQRHSGLIEYMNVLHDRLRNVRVCCGDWSRVCGPSVTHKHGMTGVFLDPPYGDLANRDNQLYRIDSLTIADDVREWCRENGNNPQMRIALCGYEGEGHEMLKEAGWAVEAWNAGEGFGGQAKTRSKNGRRERIWFSPACIGASGELPFDEVTP